MAENAQPADSVEIVERPTPQSDEGRHRPPGTLRLFLNKGQPPPERRPLFRR